MANETILIIDDEEDIVNLVSYQVEKNGYNILTSYNGEDGVEIAKSKMPDLIVLDLMLPGIDGLEVCKILKKDNETSHIPIIMVTAKDEEIDEIVGLEVGASDYISKPFSMRILMARIKSCLRNKKVKIEEVEENKEEDQYSRLLRIDPLRHEIYLNDELLVLTITQFKILSFLAKHPGRVYSRNKIIEILHDDEYVVTPRAVDVQIVGLRKKLGEHGSCIETIRSVGYRYKEI